MFSFYPMGLTSALRRKRDEIAASIAVYEARIDAARMDLAALNQVARFFDPEAGHDETHREFERVGKLEDTPPAECEVCESERPLAMGQLALPATDAAREQILEDFLYLDWP
jgi:hypothetical protein